MLRVQTPPDVTVIVGFTFERQAKPELLDCFRRLLIDSPEIERCLEMEGTYDFMIEVHLANLAAFHDFVANKIDPNRRLISHFEVSFVARYFTKEEEAGTDIWTTDRHGSRRIELARADCFTAEGDYVRVRIHGDCVLIHATLQSIRDRLPSPAFVQIHRSTIVQLASVARIVRQGRRWSVVLRDGSTHPVAKGRNSEIGRLMDEQLRPGPSHSSTTALFDGLARPNDRILEAPATR